VSSRGGACVEAAQECDAGGESEEEPAGGGEVRKTRLRCMHDLGVFYLSLPYHVPEPGSPHASSTHRCSGRHFKIFFHYYLDGSASWCPSAGGSPRRDRVTCVRRRSSTGPRSGMPRRGHFGEPRRSKIPLDYGRGTIAPDLPTVQLVYLHPHPPALVSRRLE
jgi:hypothetical protein